MTPIDVKPERKQTKRLTLTARPDVAMSTGAELAREILDGILGKIKTAVIGKIDPDPEAINSAKNMAQVFEMLEKIEVARRREDKWGEKLRSLTDEEIDRRLAQ